MIKDPQMQCTTVGAGAGAALLGAGMLCTSFHNPFIRFNDSYYSVITCHCSCSHMFTHLTLQPCWEVLLGPTLQVHVCQDCLASTFYFLA